jgi:Toprim-like
LILQKDIVREILYELNRKKYFAIGFKNNFRRLRITQPLVQRKQFPKDITTFDNNATEAIVFEAFIDFLSFMAIHKNHSKIRTDFVILNSVAFFEKARPFMEKYSIIRLYLDHDAAGQNCSRYALSLNNKYIDKSCMYQNNNDLND